MILNAPDKFDKSERFDRILLFPKFTWIDFGDQEKDFHMNINSFDVARYPLIIQVIDHLLVIYSPDFDYRVAEPYRPSDIGQTEMMILKVRREIASKMAKIGVKTPTGRPRPSQAETIIS